MSRISKLSQRSLLHAAAICALLMSATAQAQSAAEEQVLELIAYIKIMDPETMGAASE